jgi:hypothetical protein
VIRPLTQNPITAIATGRPSDSQSGSRGKSECEITTTLELDSVFTCLGVRVSNSEHLSAVCPVFFLQCGATPWPAYGRRQEADELLAPVYDWFTEGFDSKDLQEAKALLDELR